VYKEHLEYWHPQVQAGINEGLYFKATIRMNRYNPQEGWITHPEDGKVHVQLQFQQIRCRFQCMIAVGSAVNAQCSATSPPTGAPLKCIALACV
jgi:hypothetical protein